VRRQGILLAGFGIVVIALMLSPIVVLVFSSFNPTSYFRFPPSGYSLRWYVAAWNSMEYREALRVSVLVAVAATAVALPCGSLAAFALARSNLPGRPLIEAVLLAPMALPLIVWAIALLQIYARIGLSGTWLGLILAHTVIVLPFAVRIMVATFQRVDPMLEQAAATLGAAPLRAFWRISLPLALPGLATSAVFAFLISFNDVVVSSFIAGAQTMTFQVRLYSQLRSEGVDPITVAIGAVIAGLIVILAIAGERLFRWSRYV
jgi:putative spermidine/putrescine transport system permease protein